MRRSVEDTIRKVNRQLRKERQGDSSPPPKKEKKKNESSVSPENKDLFLQTMAKRSLDPSDKFEQIPAPSKDLLSALDLTKHLQDSVRLTIPKVKKSKKEQTLSSSPTPNASENTKYQTDRPEYQRALQNHQVVDGILQLAKNHKLQSPPEPQSDFQSASVPVVQTEVKSHISKERLRPINATPVMKTKANRSERSKKKN